MLDQNDLWRMEEELPVDEPVDVLLTMPEIRQLVDPHHDDGELRLRSILERPDALSKAWRQSMHAEPHQRTLKSAKRHVGVVRAA
jgi:hypothetical protein